MKPNRQEERELPQGAESPVLMAETLRNAANPSSSDAPRPATEERGGVFWRVLGGTVLSIAAMITVTLYQQITSSINDVRSSVSALNTDLRKDLGQVIQTQGDMVRKEEFNSRMSSVWASFKDVQVLQTAVTRLKERSLVRDQQEKADADVREEMRKELQKATESVVVLKEQALRREQRDKDEQARRELLDEVQKLRERLAALEGSPGTNQPVKRASHSGE
jgi:hypothetical protein